VIESATGHILRTRPLTETSLILQWLTPELGRLSTVAKGARRPKSPFAGKLDLFYLADFSFTRSRRSDLHTLREVSLRESYRPLRQDLPRLQQAAYAAALIEQTTETETPLPAIFTLLNSFLRHLESSPPQPLNVFAFEMKLLQEQGQLPDRAQIQLSPGATKLLAGLTDLDWTSLACLRLSASQTRELEQFLHRFVVFHYGRIPASRAAALQA